MKELSIKWRVVLLAAAIASAASAAGCGSDGGGDQASAGDEQAFDVHASTTLTTADSDKAQYISRLNKACREAWRVVHDNWKVHVSGQDRQLSERERFEEAVQLSLLAGIDFHIFGEVKSLGAPRGEEETVEEMIGLFQLAAETGSKGRWHAHSVAEIPPHFEEYNRRAHSYGLPDCLVNEEHLGGIEI